MNSIARQSDASRQAALRSVTILANGSRSEFDAAFTADAVNHESATEPPSSRGVGPDAFYGTALWLRAAFDDLAYDIKHTVVEDDLVAVDAMMSGRHTGVFVLYDPDGGVQTVQAPTGRTFTTRQTHWFRVVDDRVAEHWAVRDDLGQALQLGWVPPTPLHLFRNARAKRAAQYQNAYKGSSRPSA